MRKREVLMMVMCVGVMGGVVWGESKPIERAEAEAWAARFGAAMEGQRGGQIDALLDVGQMFDRSVKGLAGPRDFVRGLRQGFMSQPVGQQLAQAIAGGSYRFLNMRQERGVWYVRFRLLPGTGGLNYHDVELGRGSGGEVVGVDVKPASTGEWMSESLRRMWLGALAHNDRTVLDRLRGKDKTWVSHIDEVSALMRFVQTGRHAQALRQYEALPEAVRDMKLVMLSGLMAAGEVDEAKYMVIMNRYERLYAGDPSVVLISLDLYLMRKQFDRYFELVDQLDKMVGGDGFLHLYRGSGYLERGDLVKAEAAFAKTIAACPTLEDGYWAMIDLALRTQNHALTAKTLTGMQKHAGVELLDLRTVPEYAGFVASEEGKKWIAEHQAEGE